MSVGLAVSGHRATVTLDRPAVLNALDGEHARELERTWGELERDERVRVVVLTGAGERAFCVGADMKAGDPDGVDYLRARSAHGFGAISTRAGFPHPLVARVNGHALGGGFEMVLGCDLAVAVEEATFGLPEALVGRVPLDGGVALLAGALPPKVARELLLSGRRMAADEALAHGLVNRVVTRDQLDAAVDELVARLLAAAPLSQRAIKALLAGPDQGSPAHEPPALLGALASADGEEGVRAFREKRPPEWKAR
ncbi:enoyl-CoA hydratase-related protein [Conexibacter stalactiti]|uniref:Enoyl-CoA hydratase-related protein n=1 Tax=Conexibacter stalactiti TaxID=1940611 RepID=A0ABU4HSV7_9ACTN|nr:enoyl-CoA hydratase-related protein [Conexibacter stalactiti]MDW5596402.1 enoyl-CoA hydratase-related protein [Conexibacter stalactiti]MEC5037044.1 enoyl-CoA hydratase-related protein [Conexibacter stalactiti]